ncbi:MAG: hypothetical protein IJ842_04380 [Bacilli bacterium]|nr:hypothetical protein [Bacilli bacterium]
MKNKIKRVSIFTTILVLLSPISTFAYTKTETVFSKLNTKGEIESTNVNISLKDLEYEDVIDYSNLEKIKNINGEEKFSKDSNKITWKSLGKDIYYQGKSSDKLPVSVSTKYFLNDTEKDLKDLIGKKGNIKMIFTFDNNSYDEDYNIYTPFLITTVTMLPSKNNSNITVNNGKIINTGSTNIVTAISAPGLYEDTNIEELKQLNQVEISYDTKKFALNDIYFVLTPKLLDELDISNLSKLDSINNQMTNLKNGTNELENASKTLSDGSNDLYNNLSILNNGIKEVLNASNTLSGGLEEINNNITDINSLATLVETLYKTYNENQLLLNNINTGVTQEELTTGIKNATTEKTNLENKLKEVEANIALLNQLKENNTITEEQQNTLNNLNNLKSQLEEGILKYTNGIIEAEETLKSLPQGAIKITGANEVISKVLCGILKVESIDQINEEKVVMFKTKLNTLTNGISQLTEGSKKLNAGLNTISEGTNKLTEGSKKLTDGNNLLSNGISKLNNEGINKLMYYKDRIMNYKEKIEKLKKSTDNYKGFSSNNIDKTIFIYKLTK